MTTATAFSQLILEKKVSIVVGWCSQVSLNCTVKIQPFKRLLVPFSKHQVLPHFLPN